MDFLTDYLKKRISKSKPETCRGCDIPSQSKRNYCEVCGKKLTKNENDIFSDYIKKKFAELTEDNLKALIFASIPDFYDLVNKFPDMIDRGITGTRWIDFTNHLENRLYENLKGRIYV